jgi:uncharacterized protein (TIGR03000 family)
MKALLSLTALLALTCPAFADEPPQLVVVAEPPTLKVCPENCPCGCSVTGECTCKGPPQVRAQNIEETAKSGPKHGEKDTPRPGYQILPQVVARSVETSRMAVAGLRTDPARLVLTVPNRAKVQIGDTLTKSTGAVRTYATPPLEPGKHTYPVRVQISSRGTVWTAVQDVPVEGGKTSQVSFSWPQDAPQAFNTTPQAYPGTVYGPNSYNSATAFQGAPMGIRMGFGMFRGGMMGSGACAGGSCGR